MFYNMSYLWKDFNIKTFPAETLVFRNGAFVPELSTIEYTDINKTYDKPVHIIYVGEIYGQNDLDINLLSDNQPVFISIKIQNKKPAFLNVLLKNTGKKSEIKTSIICQNYSDLTINCKAEHKKSDTSIIVKTKLLAHKDSYTKLTGTAIINKNCENTTSDINFGAMADKSAKIQFMPAQRIQSIPNQADHSAYIYQATDFQINYLRQAGLSGQEVKQVLEEAFLNETDLF